MRGISVLEGVLRRRKSFCFGLVLVFSVKRDAQELFAVEVIAWIRQWLKTEGRLNPSRPAMETTSRTIITPYYLRCRTLTSPE